MGHLLWKLSNAKIQNALRRTSQATDRASNSTRTSKDYALALPTVIFAGEACIE
jgi:hypothetical protein